MLPKASRPDTIERETRGSVLATTFIVDGWALYLREIGSVERLTAEEERDLGQRIAEGDAAAVQRLQPSPLTGKTIYEITLSGAAKLSTMYLESPLRLVIDLS